MSDTFRLAQQAVGMCATNCLFKHLELWRLCELNDAVDRQCEQGDYGAILSTSPAKKSGRESKGGSSSCASSSQLRTMTFGNRFVEEGLVLNSQVTTQLSEAFSTTVFPNVASTKALVGAAKMKRISQSVVDIVRYLSENGLEQLALRHAVYTLSLCTLCNLEAFENAVISKTYQALLPRAAGIICDLSGELLSKVLRSHHTDKRMAMGYVTMLELKPAFDRFRAAVSATKRNFPLLSELAHVGVGFSAMWKETTFLAECDTLHRNAVWWARLSHIHVPFDRKQFETSPAAYALKLVPDIIRKSKFDLQLLLDFGVYFHLDKNQVLAEYIRMAVGNREPDNTPKHTLSFYQKCVTSASKALDDTSGLQKMLLDEYHKMVSAYDFERLQFVFGLVIDLAKGSGRQAPVSVMEWISLLGVLQHYERRVAPAQYETDFIAELEAPSPTSDDLALSKTRLPFHHLVYGNPLEILSPELSKDSVFKVAQIARLLPADLTADDIIVTFLEKLFAPGQTLPVFADIQGTIERIADDETSIMTLKMVSDRYPLGRYKLDALSMAVSKTSKWQGTIEDSEECVGVRDLQTKVGRMHERLSAVFKKTMTEFDLQENGYMTETIRALLTQPPELICGLYEEFLVSASLDVNVERLHRVTETIAARYDLSCEKLQRFVIQRWLIDTEGSLESERATGGSGGSSGGLSLAGILDGESETEDTFTQMAVDDKLRRAIALLRLEPPDSAVSYLLNFTFLEASVKVTPRAQLRAFHALFIIAPTTLICEVSNQTVEELRAYLLALTYAQRLEHLRMSQTPATFTGSNKGGLARAIWKNHRHEPVAVSLVVDLCIDFEIHDTVLWGNVLKQLVQLAEWTELARALIAVSATPQLWCVSCVQSSWTALLQEHLRRVRDAYDEESRKTTRKELLHLAIECPVVLQMQLAGDLTSIGEHDLAAKLSSPPAGKGLAPRGGVQDGVAKRITADDDDRGTPAKAKRPRPGHQPF